MVWVFINTIYRSFSFSTSHHHQNTLTHTHTLHTMSVTKRHSTSSQSDLKNRVITCINKLSDRDTLAVATTELESIAKSLSHDSFSPSLNRLQSLRSLFGSIFGYFRQWCGAKHHHDMRREVQISDVCLESHLGLQSDPESLMFLLLIYATEVVVH